MGNKWGIHNKLRIFRSGALHDYKRNNEENRVVFRLHNIGDSYFRCQGYRFNTQAIYFHTTSDISSYPVITFQNPPITFKAHQLKYRTNKELLGFAALCKYITCLILFERSNRIIKRIKISII